MARQALWMARARSTPRLTGRSDERAPLVLFAHGLMAGPGVFEPLRRHVTSHCEAVWTTVFGYPSWLRFERVAERLERFVEESIPPDRPLVLVGHSLGGLLLRWWLQERDQGRRARALLTLATPHAGSRLAERFPGPLAEALRPDGWLIESLRAGEDTLRRVPHRAAVAGLDHLVTPPRSAAQAPAREVLHLPHATHNALLFHPEVHALALRSVEDALRGR